MAHQTAVIGGGIVGISLARALALRLGDDVTVFEKESRLAVHQTGHNSGVVHAGIYYAPGSLKARLCQRGRQQIEDFCHSKSLPYREVGKLVVATDESEIDALYGLQRRALQAGVPGVALLNSDEAKDVEPHVHSVAALHSPHTASVDYGLITEAMADDVRASGGVVLLNSEVTDLIFEQGRVRIVTANGDEFANRIVVCGGLQSDRLARMVGASRSPKILPFRGEYWELAPDRSYLVRGAIYPVPDPRFPFLGVHFTRGVHGDVRVGPNAVPALSREGYTWLQMSMRDTWESLTWPGAAALARRHWRMGVKEIFSSLIKPLYFRQASRLIPELKMSDLHRKTAAGVRAQAWAADGSLLDDFAVEQVGPVTLIRNAPSPAATSSMSIADHVIDHYLT